MFIYLQTQIILISHMAHWHKTKMAHELNFNFKACDIAIAKTNKTKERDKEKERSSTKPY